MGATIISGSNLAEGNLRKILPVKVDDEGRIYIASESSLQITGPITALGTDLIPRSLGPFNATTAPTAVALVETLALAAIFHCPLSNTDAVTVRIAGSPVAVLFGGMTKVFAVSFEATLDLSDYSLVAESGTQTVHCVYTYTE